MVKVSKDGRLHDNQNGRDELVERVEAHIAVVNAGRLPNVQLFNT